MTTEDPQSIREASSETTAFDVVVVEQGQKCPGCGYEYTTLVTVKGARFWLPAIGLRWQAEQQVPCEGCGAVSSLAFRPAKEWERLKYLEEQGPIDPSRRSS